MSFCQGVIINTGVINCTWGLCHGSSTHIHKDTHKARHGKTGKTGKTGRQKTERGRKFTEGERLIDRKKEMDSEGGSERRTGETDRQEDSHTETDRDKDIQTQMRDTVPEVFVICIQHYIAALKEHSIDLVSLKHT